MHQPSALKPAASKARWNRIYPLLLTTTALATSAIPAYAACTSTAPGEYLCSNAETTPQSVGTSGANTTVGFAPNSSITTVGIAPALSVIGLDVVYADQQDTLVTGESVGLSIQAGGVIDLSVNGTLSGGLTTSSSTKARISIVNRGTINGTLESFDNTEIVLEDGSRGTYGGSPEDVGGNINLHGSNNSLVIKAGAVLPSSYLFLGGEACCLVLRVG